LRIFRIHVCTGIGEMGWEFRFFVQLPAGGPGTDSPGVLDIFSSTRPLDAGTGRCAPEDRADVYVDVQDPSLGVKFRNVDPRSGSGGKLELKVRSETKKRCAEQWSKQRSRSDDVVSLLQGVNPAAAAAAGSATRVLLRKRRWSGYAEGVAYEQTDLELLVRQPDLPAPSSAEDGSPRTPPSGHGGWKLVPRRYRTISFEGRPSDCYAVAGRWLQLPDEWELEHLNAGLYPAGRRCEAAAGDRLGAESSDAANLPTVVIGGYPQFVATLVASLPENLPAASEEALGFQRPLELGAQHCGIVQ